MIVLFIISTLSDSKKKPKAFINHTKPVPFLELRKAAPNTTLMEPQEEPRPTYIMGTSVGALKKEKER